MTSFQHTKFAALSDKERIVFLSQAIKLWFKQNNSYYKFCGLSSEDKLTQHFVKLEDFYDNAKAIMRSSIGWTLLDFAKFKSDILLCEKAKKLLYDRIFMADFNRFLDKIFREMFSQLIKKQDTTVTTMPTSSISIVEEARAKAIAMANSDDLWS